MRDMRNNTVFAAELIVLHGIWNL